MSNSNKKRIPVWMWIIAFIILQLSSEYSIFFLYTPGTADVYLTFSIGVTLIYWLGPRILVLIYINAFINSYFWGHEHFYSWFLFAIPETSFFFLSWLFFIKWGKGKFWLPNLNSVVKFLLVGISAPLTIYSLLLKHLLVLFGELDRSEIWSSIFASWLGDFMPAIIVSLPVLHYLSNLFFKGMKWEHGFMDEVPRPKSRYFLAEMLLVFLLIVALAFNLDFFKYWYLFGLISLYISVRYGFGPTTLVNLFILAVIYLIPASVYKQTTNFHFDETELFDIYLGINLLSLFSIICGRVISDYRNAQRSIQVQMEKVEKINTELDRFVYSVSHDLIAPLKSIKGLTALMKKDKSEVNTDQCISRIEESTSKLEEFIGEILDYSRSTRNGVSLANVNLELLIKENIENHQFIRGDNRANFDLSGLEVKHVLADAIQLKIILNNLISNAIKFAEHTSEMKIKFSSERQKSNIRITVEDNGCGISEEFTEKIFEMFFRASHENSGSGLGLYIAQEAAKKMNGGLTVESKEGIGSKFILTIPE